ncbi:MAG: PHB depolymerase family esterase [Myxococcales bacterium]
MMRLGSNFACLLVAGSALLAARTGKAASLQPVSNWGNSGLPSDVTMYVYVPDKVVATPPILTLIHYCGGTASAVFGQAQGGGLVKAADQYGFIMVVPSSGRCWDIVSDKTRKRDGGGDSQAIRQMVKYAVEKYHGNADRVYSTGDSSGGMMTELLLAVYPDVFKAGSAFAGMPAGCRGANESGSGGGYSGACAGGSVTHTAQEWGDIARGLDPGYSGHRPRVQLFHGDADTTIKYANFTEAIKEWTNVLGLSANPTSTDTSITLGTHQAKRQTWLNTCGFADVDAFTSIGGDHGPSDTLFVAKYVVPFLGLDKTGAVDPEVEQCSSGGAGGSGAGGSSGATNGGGGTSGNVGSGGAGFGGNTGAAGGVAFGGASTGLGGAAGASGGNTASAGSPSGGGMPGVAGNQATASSGAPSAGALNAGSAGDAPAGDAGCTCGVAQRRSGNSVAAFTALAISLALGWRRRRRAL